MFPRLLAVALSLLMPALAAAQPFNVRTWYAKGQVFVVWQFVAPPAVQTDTVEIYSSAAAQVTVANMTQVGRMFYPEYVGSRLTELMAGARLLIPTPAGGTYRLAADEGVFAYTPHAAGNLFFAVVDTGSVVVNAGNSASAFFGYDPVNDPVIAHPQFSGFTPGGNPYSAFVLWGDGRANVNDARPDVPVIGNASKNGVPEIFTITRPLGALPGGPVPATLVLHGGEDNYALFRPGVPDRNNMSLAMAGGVAITPDDSLFLNNGGVLLNDSCSWFGYSSSFDPFFGGARAAPGPGEIITNYKHRFLHWIITWLAGPTSPQPIDPDRVAGIGHSAGGRGISHVSRARPELFSSVVCYTPASDLTQTSFNINYLRGDWVQNAPTNVIGPGGVSLGVTDIFTSTTRISQTQRDFPLTRFYYGKRDQKDSATWSPAQRAVVDALNDGRSGAMIYWDEREHGVEKWDNETSDLNDGNPDPWPDVAQWIVPPAPIGGPKTRIPAADTLANTDRASLSYPGFFNSDVDAITVGRQPDPGAGDPSLGDPWGTWTGCLSWDRASLTDTAGQWSCVAYATGIEPAPIDNSLFASVTTDLVPRRTSNFAPPLGATVTWYVLNAGSGALLQNGSTLAEGDGVVAVSGISVPQDPQRVRILLCTGNATCPGDANGTGTVNFADITSVLTNFGATISSCATPGDSDHNGLVNFADITATLTRFGLPCP